MQESSRPTQVFTLGSGAADIGLARANLVPPFLMKAQVV